MSSTDKTPLPGLEPEPHTPQQGKGSNAPEIYGPGMYEAWNSESWHPRLGIRRPGEAPAKRPRRTFRQWLRDLVGR